MYADDWERLGLGPTRDLLAIKKAYALRLRHTRPDDDAQAYQALREAYERAQHWARYAPDEEDAGDEAKPSPPVVLEEAPAPPSATAALEASPSEPAPEDPDLALPEDETPEAIVDRCYHGWRQHGDEALIAVWPHVEALLDRLPLVRRPEASARFADLVITVDDLPEPFVHRLRDHFGWLGDFRVDRMIGPRRAEALREALSRPAASRPITDPAVLEPLADLRVLSRLLEQGRRPSAWLHTTLLGAPLLYLRRQLDARLLSAAIVPNELSRADSALEAALWIRAIATVLTLFGVSGWIMKGQLGDAFGPAFVTVVISAVVLGVSLAVGPWLSAALNVGATAGPAWLARLAQLRERARPPFLVLLLLVASALCFSGEFPDPPTVWMAWMGAGLCLAAAVIGWPASPLMGVMTVCTWGFLTLCLVRLFPLAERFEAPLASVAGLLTLMAASHAALPWRQLVGRWAGIVTIPVALTAYQMGSYLARPEFALWTLSLAGAAIAVMLTMGLAHRQGFRTAMAPMALTQGVTLAVGMQSGGRGLPGPVVALLWAGVLVLFIVATELAAWADRRLFRSVRDSL